MIDNAKKLPHLPRFTELSFGFSQSSADCDVLLLRVESSDGDGGTVRRAFSGPPLIDACPMNGTETRHMIWSAWHKLLFNRCRLTAFRHLHSELFCRQDRTYRARSNV